MDVSRRFYEAALAPLGYETSVESPELVDMQAAGRNDFGLVRRDPVGPTVHLGFEAPDRAAVDAFHDAALAAGGKDNGGPRAPARIWRQLLRRVRDWPRRA